MIPGNESARESIRFIDPGDVELLDHVTAQLVMFPRNNSGPTDIVQSARDFQEAPFLRTEPVEHAEPIEKGEREGRNLFIVGRIGVVGSRDFRDEGHRGLLFWLAHVSYPLTAS